MPFFQQSCIFLKERDKEKKEKKKEEQQPKANHHYKIPKDVKIVFWSLAATIALALVWMAYCSGGS